MSEGNGSWSWHLFQHLLSSNILLQVVAIKGPFPALSCDFIGWRSSLNRRFTVRLAYAVHMVVDSSRQITGVLFSLNIKDWIGVNLAKSTTFAVEDRD
ncbi:hypothetical protein V6N11_047066 [Hibiscus sabdariffa]|uniref:Uncharacterized protein n=1 Tax=Hibiscus sabdariffa TaxID=183260 RepID=A0ABR1ZXI3_9ROSI